MIKNFRILEYGNFPFGSASANLLRNFSLALIEKGNNVEVILPVGSHGENIAKESKRKGCFQQIKYTRTGFILHPKNHIGKIVDFLIGNIMLIFYLINNNLTKKDPIIAYNTSFTKTSILLLIKLFFRIKVIIILPEFYEKPKVKLLSIQYIKWINFLFGMKYLIKYADGFIVLSNYLKNYIKKDLQCEKKCIIMPNVINPTSFEMKTNSIFKKNQITIGYVGTPTKKDGTIDLIKSFSILNKKNRDTHLLIIGDIINGKSLVPQLKKIAKEEGVLNNVTITGFISFNKVPTLLNSCQILALARPNGVFAEAGFPTKLGEYFACRKPVVITKVGDIPSYFQNKKEVILVEPNDIQDISRGFEYLIKNPDEAEKIANNGYNWMKENLDYRNIANHINDFVNSVQDSISQ